jgi:hypothetical protein
MDGRLSRIYAAPWTNGQDPVRRGRSGARPFELGAAPERQLRW